MFWFIFISPIFIKEKGENQKCGIYISCLSREISLYGVESEIKLRSEVIQCTITKECADRICRKGKFKSNTTSENIMGFATIDNGTV